MASLGAPFTTPDPAERDASRRCAECGAPFAPRDQQQLFCSPAHRRAWANRWTTRGAVIGPLLAVARITRAGTRGAERTLSAKAGRDADTLLRRWRAEDHAAGRMDWTEHNRRRYELGYDPVR